jgi:hypothetical protein
MTQDPQDINDARQAANDARQDVNDARQEVNDALSKAEAARTMAERLADGWRRSRDNNNFRAMIRNLNPEGAARR